MVFEGVCGVWGMGCGGVYPEAFGRSDRKKGGDTTHVSTRVYILMCVELMCMFVCLYYVEFRCLRG